MSSDVPTASPLPRLTASVRQQLLDHNGGMTIQTHFSDRNSRESRTYTIVDGMLRIRAHGKGAFGGSQYDQEWTAAPDEVHRFLGKYQHKLDNSRVDPTLKLPKADPIAVALEGIPGDIADALAEEAAPEAQSKVAKWFDGLTAREKLVFGTVVVVVAVGGVVVYRYRQSIAEKVTGAARSVRQKFTRSPRGDARGEEPGEAPSI